MFRSRASLGTAALVCWIAGCADDSYPDSAGGGPRLRGGGEGGRGAVSEELQPLGPSGEGDGPQAKSLDPPPADLRNLSGARADRGYWFLRIQRGGKEGPLPRERSAMPGWGEHLSDEQIWQLVSYLDAIAEGPP